MPKSRTLLNHPETIPLALIEKVNAKLKKTEYFHALCTQDFGDNPDDMPCFTLPLSELKGMGNLSKEIERVGEHSNFLGVRYGISPHDDAHIPGAWSNFVILHNDGFALRSGKYVDDNRWDDQVGTIQSLNIHKVHWLEPANRRKLDQPYLWLALCVQSNYSIKTDKLKNLMTKHLEGYLAL